MNISQEKETKREHTIFVNRDTVHGNNFLQRIVELFLFITIIFFLVELYYNIGL